MKFYGNEKVLHTFGRDGNCASEVMRMRGGVSAMYMMQYIGVRSSGCRAFLKIHFRLVVMDLNGISE